MYIYLFRILYITKTKTQQDDLKNTTGSFGYLYVVLYESRVSRYVCQRKFLLIVEMYKKIEKSVYVYMYGYCIWIILRIFL